MADTSGCHLSGSRKTGKSLAGVDLSGFARSEFEKEVLEAQSEPEDYDLHCDRALNEAGNRSAFYGQPAGDLPQCAAVPLG